MENNNQNKLFNRLIESLNDDFNDAERNDILEELKYINPTNDALLGAKMLLEENNWDYSVLKKGFLKTEEKIKLKENNIYKQKFSLLKYAAVLLPIGFIIGYFMYNSNVNNSIDSFYVPEEGLPNLMSDTITNWDTLMELYKSDEMEKAFRVSKELLQQKPKNDTAIYFHGIIAYNLKKYSTAKIDFKNLDSKKESVFYHDAAYRMGFVLYHLNNKKEAKILFEKIYNDTDNPYNNEAAKILSVLD